jgi:hypothetical protein
MIYTGVRFAMPVFFFLIPKKKKSEKVKKKEEEINKAAVPRRFLPASSTRHGSRLGPK